jgi:very-short-patch-repair endonuclease
MNALTARPLGLARMLRKQSTDAERLFWSRVRGHRLNGYKFKRQHPIGCYIVDFVCIEVRLVVELDGGQHAKSNADKTRDAQLRNQGYRVLRFWNNDVLSNIDGVVEQLIENLRPSPLPSPKTGEGLRVRVECEVGTK